MTALVTRMTETDGVAVLALYGELTASTVHQFETGVTGPLGLVYTPVVIDLSGVDGWDAIGVMVLGVEITSAVGHGSDIRLAAPAAAMCRLLRDAGTTRTVPTYGSVEGAVHTDPVDLLGLPDGG